ncbi:unnamed protein product [Meganyctiphanes norvegica]|uniref:BZIP domain-containing protein n=1 Tax=Meganyctiphanes norvegica TaxID=48144 RepID=A0AAV2RAD6_MEGNR
MCCDIYLHLDIVKVINIDIMCDKVEGRDCGHSPKFILQNKIIMKRKLSLDNEEHPAPLDLSSKSRVIATPHGSKDLDKHNKPQHFHQTPPIQLYPYRNVRPQLIPIAYHNYREYTPAVRVPPLHNYPPNGLPTVAVSPASTSNHIFQSSNSLTTLEPVPYGRFTSQPYSTSQNIHEDPDSPMSISSFQYSDEELQRYPKGALRRQRILQNSLSEVEASQRVRTINNESSKRYRQRKHLAQKQTKDEEEKLLTKHCELKEQYDKLKQESDMYYSYFRRNWF